MTRFESYLAHQFDGGDHALNAAAVGHIDKRETVGHEIIPHVHDFRLREEDDTVSIGVAVGEVDRADVLALELLNRAYVENLHIVALDPVNDTTLVTLDQFAERLNAERAVEYQFTRASVYRGQQQGWEVPRIQAWLREQTGAELPANVARTLETALIQGGRNACESDPSVAQ